MIVSCAGLPWGVVGEDYETMEEEDRRLVQHMVWNKGRPGGQLSPSGTWFHPASGPLMLVRHL